MKSFTSLKSFAIIACLTLFLASCSNERYGNIQRGTVKTKETAKVEKTSPTLLEATAEVAQTPTISESFTTPEIMTTFNAAKAVKTVQASTAKEKISKAIISKIIKHTLAPVVNATSPYTIDTALNHKGSGHHAVEKGILILLAILIPPVAVGLVSDWGDTSALLISIILTILCWIPGIIHAIIYVNKNS